MIIKHYSQKTEQRSSECVRRTYADNIEKFYAIINNMKIIGFIMLEKLQNNPFYMDYFAIKKEYQNQGLGTNALKILLNDVIKEKGLCIEIENNINNVYEIAKKTINEKTEIIPELTDEWYNRLFFPIGIDPDNNINLV
jgi:ribosomal protein S18 acetylase RimI-like enzyme